MRNRIFMNFGVFLALMSIGDMALAADVMGDGICALAKMLTGKWLFGFSLLAALGGGAALLFGGEMSDGLKRLATLITIVAMILATSSLLTALFAAASITGAC